MRTNQCLLSVDANEAHVFDNNICKRTRAPSGQYKGAGVFRVCRVCILRMRSR